MRETLVFFDNKDEPLFLFNPKSKYPAICTDKTFKSHSYFEEELVNINNLQTFEKSIHIWRKIRNAEKPRIRQIQETKRKEVKIEKYLNIDLEQK